MTETERLAAIEAIRAIKARYFYGTDTGDSALVRAILAEDCVLDYVGCFTDPTSGKDYFPAMNVVLRGSASFGSALKDIGIVSVHQGHQVEIVIESATTARGTWAMTDRLWLPPGGEYSFLRGFGFYHETYTKVGDGWRIQTTRIERLRVEGE